MKSAKPRRPKTVAWKGAVAGARKCEDFVEPTDEECQTKTTKNGCVERGCGWSEKTGKCNKGCAKFSKAECPPKRCRVNGDACEDGLPELPTDPGCYIHAPKGCAKRTE